MLNDISFKDIHMCRINVTHTICIWGNHIFDSNFENTLPLNRHCLKLCRSIVMPDDCMNRVKEKHRDDDTVGKEYIECCKFNIPKQFIHLMDGKKKRIDGENILKILRAVTDIQLLGTEKMMTIIRGKNT